MSIAEAYGGFLIDLDGVIWRGSEPVPGAAETATALVEAGRPVCFLTNNARSPVAGKVERLRELGVPVGEGGVLGAGQVAIDRVRADLAGAGSGAGVLVVGSESFRAEAAAAGLRLADTATADGAAAAVIVSGHEGFDYAELKAATDALSTGAAFYATNRDPTLPMPDGLWPGTGAILAAVEAASGRRATVCGKPELAMFETALARLAAATGPPARVAMIGDRLDSDIAGARDAGLATILVLSGSTDRAQLRRSPVEPDHVLKSLAEIAR